MYRSVYEWRDLDDGHFYRIGDVYPHDGREISEQRITELSGSRNKAGCVLIEAVNEENPTPDAGTGKTTKILPKNDIPGGKETEQKPKPAKAAPKTGKKSTRKTADQ